MKRILVLPGFSPHNQDWLDKITASLKPLGEIVPVPWQHWQAEEVPSDWQETELKRIESKISNEPITIVAKSTGTLLAAQLLARYGDQVDKLVLCGLPLNDISAEQQLLYHHLKTLPPENVLILQNNNDPHGSYKQVLDLLQQLKLKHQVSSQTGDTHEYIYPEIILSFLEK